MIITIISKISGLLRDLFLTYFFGVSAISDAYIISLTIPNIIFGFIGAGLAASYIPMLTSVEHKEGNSKADEFTSNLTNIMLVLIFIVFVLCQMNVESIIRFIGLGFNDDTMKMAITLTRYSLIGIFTTFLISIFSGYLQVKGNYIVPSLIGLPMNIIVIASIALSSKGNINILGFGTAIAFVSQFLLLLPFIIRKQFKHSKIIDIRDGNIKAMLITAVPVIIGTSVNRINVLVDRMIATKVTVGGVSALNYADELNSFVQAIFVISIATAMYPMISKMVAEDNIQGLKNSLKRVIGSVNIIVVPITIGTLLYNNEIVNLVFGRGAFDITAIDLTAQALFYYAFGMLGFGLRGILIRVFYSIKDTKTPVINASIGVLINIILNVILSKFLGIGGLALATSIAATFTTVLMIVSLRKKIGPFGLSQLLVSFLKVLLASILMGVISKYSYFFISQFLHQTFALFIGIGVGVLSYFIIIYFSKLEDVESLITIFKKKIKRS